MFDRDSWIYQHPGPAIGKVFTGNKELAEAYWGVGMAMLFNVKSRMREGLLGSLSMNRAMGDGTVIQVQSFYGQDLIRIDAPFIPAPAENPQVELSFKITGSDGTIMTDSPDVNEYTYFLVEMADGQSSYFGAFYSDGRPVDDSDTLLLFFDEDSNYWTLRKRATNDDGTPDKNDLTGSMFEPDDAFWVEYTFGGINDDFMREWTATTQYKSITNTNDFFKDEDLIQPGMYEDTVLMQQNYFFAFDVKSHLGEARQAGITVRVKDSLGNIFAGNPQYPTTGTYAGKVVVPVGHATRASKTLYLSAGFNGGLNISDPEAKFLKSGFMAGDTVKISGWTTPGNNSYRVIAEMTAGAMSFVDSTGMEYEPSGQFVSLETVSKDQRSYTFRFEPPNGQYEKTETASGGDLAVVPDKTYTSDDMLPVVNSITLNYAKVWPTVITENSYTRTFLSTVPYVLNSEYKNQIISDYHGLCHASPHICGRDGIGWGWCFYPPGGPWGNESVITSFTDIRPFTVINHDASPEGYTFSYSMEDQSASDVIVKCISCQNDVDLFKTYVGYGLNMYMNVQYYIIPRDF